MDAYEVQAVVYKEGKRYVAECLNVDVASFGDTEAEALENIQDALELYFEDSAVEPMTSVEAPALHRLTVQRA